MNNLTNLQKILMGLLAVFAVFNLYWWSIPNIDLAKIATCKHIAIKAGNILYKTHNVTDGDIYITYAIMLDLYQESIGENQVLPSKSLSDHELASTFSDLQCLKLVDNPNINKFLNKAKQITQSNKFST